MPSLWRTKYFTQILYAIKSSCRRGMNFSRFIGHINIGRPTLSFFGSGAKNLTTLARDLVGWRKGCYCSPPTCPDSVPTGKGFSLGLSMSSHSFLHASLDSQQWQWWNVDQVRMDRFICWINNLSLHLCHGWYYHELFSKPSEGRPLSFKSPGLNISYTSCDVCWCSDEGIF